jgi:hypothetical protein
MDLYPLEAEMAILARVISMRLEELEEFDQAQPTDLRHYLQVEKNWINRDVRLLENRLRRKATAREIADHITRTATSLRFRAYYAMRFPERVCFPSRCFQEDYFADALAV